MSIWKRSFTAAEANGFNKGNMSELLGIEIIEKGDDYLKGRILIDAQKRQTFGVMHGGASCALAETLASVAANYCVDKTHYCVGLDINTSHLRMVEAGWVTGIAKPIHIGSKIQVWEIKAYDESQKLVAWSRLTVANLVRNT